jgi:2-oxoglutarate dehydrogenase E2 component (dihydrolipoamide succinyltransferase)
MRKMISQRMLESKAISPHVTSFMETDMTAVVNWRLRLKDSFTKEFKENLTFTPILIEAVAHAIKKYPGINIQVSGDNIIYKKDINIGMAVALPNGNLIVPVIHQADKYSLSQLSVKVNDLAKRARNNQLKPEELSGGTYTITNSTSYYCINDGNQLYSYLYFAFGPDDTGVKSIITTPFDTTELSLTY